MTATSTSALPVSGPPRALFVALVLFVTTAVGITVGAVIQRTGLGDDRAASVAFWPDEPLAQHTPSYFRSGWPDEPLAQHTPHLFGSDAIDPSVVATEAYGRERVLRMMEQAGGAYRGANQGEDEPLRVRLHVN